MSRPYLFGTNFKMNQTPAESARFYQQLSRELRDRRGLAGLHHPALHVTGRRDGRRRGRQPPHLDRGAERPLGARRRLHRRDLGRHAAGARRRSGAARPRRAAPLFHEKDVDLNRKVHAVLGAGLRVLLAVGETAEERNFGVSGETVARQLKIDLHGVTPEIRPDLVQIAYEPVWSIGAGGTPARPADVEPIAALIRATLDELFGEPGQSSPHPLRRQRRPHQRRLLHRPPRHRRSLRRPRRLDGPRLHRHLRSRPRRPRDNARTPFVMHLPACRLNVYSVLDSPHASRLASCRLAVSQSIIAG